MKIFSNIEEWSIDESKNSPFKQGDYLRVTGQMILDKKIHLLDHQWREMEATNARQPSYSVRYDYKISLDVVEKFKDHSLFYIQVDKVGMKWAEGKILFINADLNRGNLVGKRARFNMKVVENVPNNSELQILLKEEGLYSTIRDGKFLTGTETFVMDSSGNKVEDFENGVYIPAGYNFKLTNKIRTSVVDIAEKSKDFNPDDCLSIKIEDFANLQENLPDEKLQVVASAMSKIIGAEVEVEDGEFRIPWFYVTSKSMENSPFKSVHNATPFFTRDQAERHIEHMKEMSKKERLPFDVNTLEVKMGSTHQRYELSFAQLIEYAKSFGIDFNLAEFMEKHKGGVAAKKFGFN